MRRLTMTALAMLAAGPVFAQVPLNSCEEIPELATFVMARRQVNYDIMLMINYMNAEYSDYPELMSWAQAMIDMAYTEPVSGDPQARQAQVEAFKARWLERCEATHS